MKETHLWTEEDIENLSKAFNQKVDTAFELQQALRAVESENEKLKASLENRDLAFKMAFEAAQEKMKKIEELEKALKAFTEWGTDDCPGECWDGRFTLFVKRSMCLECENKEKGKVNAGT